MKINKDEIAEIETIICLGTLGGFNAIKNHSLHIEQGDRLLTNPYQMNVAKKLRLSSKIRLILGLGSEIENVKSMIPYALNRSLHDLERRCITEIRKRTS